MTPYLSANCNYTGVAASGAAGELLAPDCIKLMGVCRPKLFTPLFAPCFGLCAQLGAILVQLRIRIAQVCVKWKV